MALRFNDSNLQITPSSVLQESDFGVDILAHHIPKGSKVNFEYVHPGTDIVSRVSVRFVVSDDESSVYVDADVEGSKNSWATSTSGRVSAAQLLTEARIVALKAIGT